MSKFKVWFESHQSEKQQKVAEIWGDVFKSLGIGGLADEDAAYQSLSKITYGQRRPTSAGTSTFKGKKAAYKRLESGQIFNRLLQLEDPVISKQVEDVKHWLGTNDDDPKTQNNGDTTVAMLLQKLFGQDYHQLIDSDAPIADTKLSKAPAQPPKNDMGIDGPPAVDPNTTGQQVPMTPPTPAANQQMQPMAPRPPRPAPNQMMPGMI